MNTREEKIYNSDFFKDKQDLAKQLIDFENNGCGFLPNSPNYAFIPPSGIQFGDKQVTLGRIDKYYYFGIETNENVWKYHAFEDEGTCNLFFHDIPDIDEKTLAFWLLQIKRLSEKF
ncbi:MULTISPECIES: DUF3964 family protein [Bacillus cereus group]|uniref:DUF3964 family protein n=1 Tax=Bacillus cereus group TaxID=86661 RepID=UPI0022DF1FFC|nr:DUF3964 family protein [Bacillus cereus group sp. TH152-1LC]MDA1674804.1 DUF3964 family protein [Bacillus cereus group sp. TH152-1LC]